MAGSGQLALPEPSQDSASLLKRLAGPSTNKAGLAKDQTEINQVIAAASKGSKFYENEKRKDKDLTEKIARILKQKEEAMSGADIHQIERSVDQLLAKMEAQRDLTQIIVHVDMDAFFASVELLDDPQLANKPFAVGGGVVSTASYEARKHGVRSGMPVYIARKLCPQLVVVKSHYARYTEMSKKVMEVFKRYDPNMHVAGCDEGYLNITQYCEEHLIDAEHCVAQMRQAVQEETKLTASAGIAPNKMLAKICSDKNKPNGQFQLDFNPEAIKAFMKDLSIRKVPGVGRVNERLLESIGIKTCGDIYTHRATISVMDQRFGLNFLLQTYLGIASNDVRPGEREERKSMGAERTFKALADKEKILEKLREIAAELEKDLESSGWTGKTVSLKYKLDTYQVFTRAKSFDTWISTKKENLFAIGKELLLPELPLSIRLIGLRVTKLKDLRKDLGNSGIKRFFEPVNSSASASRKRIVEVDDHEHLLAGDGYEVAMPGYHEHEEDDGDTSLAIDQSTAAEAGLPEHDLLEIEPVKQDGSRPRPPVSAPIPSTSFSTPSSFRKASKPVSSSSTLPSHVVPDRVKHPPADPSASSLGKRCSSSSDLQTQTCPICARTLETDNQGFNEHIDFCLSKGAIREAQAMATVRTTPSVEFMSGNPVIHKQTRGAKKRKR